MCFAVPRASEKFYYVSPMGDPGFNFCPAIARLLLVLFTASQNHVLIHIDPKDHWTWTQRKNNGIVTPKLSDLKRCCDNPSLEGQMQTPMVSPCFSCNCYEAFHRTIQDQWFSHVFLSGRPG